MRGVALEAGGRVDARTGPDYEIRCPSAGQSCTHTQLHTQPHTWSLSYVWRLFCLKCACLESLLRHLDNLVLTSVFESTRKPRMHALSDSMEVGRRAPTLATSSPLPSSDRILPGAPHQACKPRYTKRAAGGKTRAARHAARRREQRICRSSSGCPASIIRFLAAFDDPLTPHLGSASSPQHGPRRISSIRRLRRRCAAVAKKFQCIRAFSPPQVYLRSKSRFGACTLPRTLLVSVC